MAQETVTNGTEALFTREGMPPVKEMIPCALQHVLASFAGIITPAVIMAGVYGFNSQQSTDIIQVALILSAIDTALQAFAPFRRIGGGLLGGLPTSALGQNVGIICSNKVVNKWVFVIIASVFAIAGLFPQLSAVLSAIPQPVIGGATVGVFGTITMNGVRMFTREGLTQRTTTIVGTSVVFGLGIWMASGCLAGEGMPTWVSTVIGSNAVTPTAIMAIVLNLILPQTPVVAQHIDAVKDAAVDLVLPESKK